MNPAYYLIPRYAIFCYILPPSSVDIVFRPLAFKEGYWFPWILCHRGQEGLDVSVVSQLGKCNIDGVGSLLAIHPYLDIGDLYAAKEYARENLNSMWHYAGSCSMLPREKDGVVDSSLRVYGIEGLRIVDVSAIPLVSTANLQATMYAFAGRVADIIKRD